MNRIFLYIDILGFENLVINHSQKVEIIFSIIDRLNVHKHFALQTIVFSDTILIFNKNDDYAGHYYVTYLIEYAQQLFYNLSLSNIYFKGIITFGEFNFTRLDNIDAYYGLALVDAHNDEKKLDGFGLFINKNLNDDVTTFDKIDFDEKYDFVLLCQSTINLYRDTNGVLPIEDVNMLSETDTYFRIDEDLRFFREIKYLKDNHSDKKVREKHKKIYNLYKTTLPIFFQKFEEQGFLPFTIHSDYMGKLNPFTILAESEMNNVEHQQHQNLWQH